jgi:hypothetical protein
MLELLGVSITDEFPRPNQTAIATAEPVQVCWEFWREAQQRSFHGAPAVIELGEIGGDE